MLCKVFENLIRNRISNFSGMILIVFNMVPSKVNQHYLIFWNLFILMEVDDVDIIYLDFSNAFDTVHEFKS